MASASLEKPNKVIAAFWSRSRLFSAGAGADLFQLKLEFLPFGRVWHRLLSEALERYRYQ